MARPPAGGMELPPRPKSGLAAVLSDDGSASDGEGGSPAPRVYTAAPGENAGCDDTLQLGCWDGNGALHAPLCPCLRHPCFASCR